MSWCEHHRKNERGLHKCKLGHPIDQRDPHALIYRMPCYDLVHADWQKDSCEDAKYYEVEMTKRIREFTMAMRDKKRREPNNRNKHED